MPRKPAGWTLVQRHASHLRLLAGNRARYAPLSAVANSLLVTPDFVRYNHAKVVNPAFHSGKHGGARNFKFSATEMAQIEVIVWLLLKADPLRSDQEYVTELVNSGFHVNRIWVNRLFKRWGMTTKMARWKQALKFTSENLLYYQHYIIGIRLIPWQQLKFVDESSYQSKRLMRTHGRAPRGTPLQATSTAPTVASYTITLVTSLVSDPPFYVSEFRVGSNSARDFFFYIVDLLEIGALVPGDIVILDNASIHYAAEIADPLADVLDSFHVRLVFLPTYSPELNPCELVLAQTKGWLRRHRNLSCSFAAEIVRSFGTVSLANIVAYYGKCIEHIFD